MAYNEEVTMMMSVVPGAMTGISAMMGGLASITNVFTDVTRQIDANFGLIDAGIITASTIVAQFGLEAANAFGSFEQGLKIAQMVSNQTADDMDYLRNKANEFAVSYRTDIDQITEGLQTLGRAGLNSASEQTEVLKEGLSTAKLESRDLNGVLEELIQNTALLGGNLKESNFGEDSKYVNDLLVATSMTAPITTHDVSETLKYSGGIAAAAGANIRTDSGEVNEAGKAILEDYMGAIAAFAQKGVTGSIAGTALRAFFNKPATQDSSVTDALASIHLKPEYLWEDDEETMKPVSEQIKIITDQMDELDVSTMDRLQIWSKIVGGKMGQQMIKLDSEDIKDLTKDIRSANDAESLAAGTFETYQMKMKEMTEQGQVAFRQFGEYAAKVLTPILQILKIILEIFSNPIISGVAFVGAISLIVSAISKAKNVISSLRNEFKTIHDYILTGDKLLAKRPSTERKENRTKGKDRFSSENLSRKYPGVSSVTAYGKERQLQAEERLIREGRTLGEIDVLRQANKLRGESFISSSKNDYTKEVLFPKNTRPIPLDNIDDSFIVKTLVERGLWNEKLTNSYYELGRDLPATLSANRDDIIDMIYKEFRKTPSSHADTHSNKKNLQSETGKSSYLTEEQVELKNKEIAERNKEFEEFKKNSLFGIDGASVFDYKGMKDDIKQRKWALEKSGKTYGANNLAFNEIPGFVQAQYVNAFVDDIEKNLFYPLQFFDTRHHDYNNKLSGDERGKPAELMDHLAARGLIPANDEITDAIEEEIYRRIDYQKEQVMEKALGELKKTLEPGQTLADKGLLSRKSFIESTKGLNLNNIDMNDFQRYVLGMAGISDGLQALSEREIRKPTFANRQKDKAVKQRLVSDEDLAVLFEEDLKSMQKASGWGSVRDNVDPIRLANQKDRDRKKMANFDAAAERIKQIQRDRLKSFDYWTLDDLSLRKSQLPDKERYLTIDDIKNFVAKNYGVQVAGKSRAQIAKNAIPFLSDWSITGHDGGMTNQEFRDFAKRIGADVNEKDNRATMINKVNEALLQKEILQLKKEILKVEEDLKEQEKAILEYYAEEAQLARQTEAYRRDQQDTNDFFYKTGLKNVFDEEQEKYDKVTELLNTPYVSGIVGPGEEFLTPVPPRIVEQRKVDANILSKDDIKDSKFEPRASYDIEKRQSRKTPSQIIEEELRRQRAEKRFRELGFSDDDLLKLGIISGKPTQDFIGPKLPESRGGGKDPQKLGIIDSLGVKLSGFFDNISNREGHMLGFKKADTTTKKFANGLLNASELVGGPFFAAIELASVAISMWQQEFEKYAQSLKEAEDSVKEAFSKRDSAEDSLRRTYQEGNPDATDEEIDQMIYDTYNTMNDDMAKAVEKGQGEWLKKLNTEAEKGTELVYDEEKDDGSTVEKEEEELSSEEEYQKAIKENTGALYAATAELNVALSKLSSKMTDSWWGVDGWTGWLTDQWGGAMDQIFKGGSKFSDDNEFLLTQSQADENYSGYTEMAGLMMEDFKDAGGNWIKGMRTMMGDDVEDLAKIIPKSGQTWMTTLATGTAGIKARDNAKIQASMKNDTKTWKKLAREYAKLDVNKKQGRSTDKNLNRIKGLITKVQGTLSNGFNETHIKQAAYLMQMQEMYNVAQNSIVPIISTNTSLAGSTLLAANGISTKTGNTAANAGGTWGTAQVISGMVAIIAKAQAKDVAWQTAYEADPNSTDLNGDGYDETDKAIIELAQKTNSSDDFAKEAAKLYNQGSSSKIAPYNRHGVYSDRAFDDKNKDQAAALFIAQVYEAGAKMTGYGYSADAANKKAQEDVKSMAGKSLADIYNTLGKNYTENPAFHQMLIDNYLNATEEDEGDGSGGGGSGSGSGDKDKDNGTRKERVDLVLCNRKTIPKLNVNLFKKPPSFTILNKNFKLRDVRINSEDKPKAIMAAIKNSFIDIQKRTDPKIIQDEDAVYDPAAATDGTNVPSGSAKTNTS